MQCNAAASSPVVMVLTGRVALTAETCAAASACWWATCAAACWCEVSGPEWRWHRWHRWHSHCLAGEAAKKSNPTSLTADPAAGDALRCEWVAWPHGPRSRQGRASVGARSHESSWACHWPASTGASLSSSSGRRSYLSFHLPRTTPRLCSLPHNHDPPAAARRTRLTLP